MIYRNGVLSITTDVRVCLKFIELLSMYQFDRIFPDEDEPEEPTTPEPDAWDMER